MLYFRTFMLFVLMSTGVAHSQTKSIPVATFNSVSMFGSKHDGVGGMPVLIGSEATTSILLSSNSKGSLSTSETLSNTISIYPNPANDVLSINTQVNKIAIINLEGKVVHTQQNCNEVDLKDIPTGMYFINITTENNSFNFKLIKQ